MAAPQPTHFKQRAMCSRDDLATRLRELADQIARGRLSFDRGTVPIAEQVAYELEFEAEHGKSELSIELEWQ
jgi:amphi-Trp domain-containing protein